MEDLDNVVSWVSSGVCVFAFASLLVVSCDVCPRSGLMKETRKDTAIWCLSFSGLCCYCLSVCVCVCVCVHLQGASVCQNQYVMFVCVSGIHGPLQFFIFHPILSLFFILKRQHIHGTEEDTPSCVRC